ncbi:50S ribosomal protein L3 [Candidatus Peregrinibacteria bacterium RIFCSPLOWO2_02_FULL_48_14]|nr:MAG: 50S ribosomal protein L3 [Candidatus Peregrinibacteria bacterium RIFCSPLOWO2_01_FULL_48_20]OGJ43584.1 MAG: 50S ribosomal protein L3 [Candidatus Peregrinibacteria bacterium RIFCSPLOWO2_02_FULL_48_14]
MSGILGKKIGMTRLIQDDGQVIPLTVIECQPNTVVQVKTVEKDGYPAVVLGFDAVHKPTKNRKFRFLREFRIENTDSLKIGDQVNVDGFAVGDRAKVTGTSKGKGFQGVVRRHHFAGGPASHGSHMKREPGSIGARARPGKVHKGKRMAGHMGLERVTEMKEVVYVDMEKNLIGLKGAVPGGNGTLVIIKHFSA